MGPGSSVQVRCEDFAACQLMPLQWAATELWLRQSRVTKPCSCSRRWLDGSSLIYADNVHGLRLDPPNQIMNTANCTHVNYRRPIILGTNATDVTFADGRNYMA